jgi:osmotically-inducible protein OsmY
MTDECLRGVVLLALSNDADLAPLDLRVGVLNGIVHLCGSAPTLALWESAGRVAGTVPGVRAVINRVCSPGAPHPIRTIHLDLFQKE